MTYSKSLSVVRVAAWEAPHKADTKGSLVRSSQPELLTPAEEAGRAKGPHQHGRMVWSLHDPIELETNTDPNPHASFRATVPPVGRALNTLCAV